MTSVASVRSASAWDGSGCGFGCLLTAAVIFTFSPQNTFGRELCGVKRMDDVEVGAIGTCDRRLVDNDVSDSGDRTHQVSRNLIVSDTKKWVLSEVELNPHGWHKRQKGEQGGFCFDQR